MHKITSSTNPQIKELIKIYGSKSYRDEKGMFVCEGVRLTEDFLNAGYVPVQSYITESSINANEHIFDKLSHLSEQCFIISENVSQKISDTKSPQGVYALFHMREQEDTSLSADKNYIMLSSVRDPGNVGTVIRTCAAFGVDALIITKDCADIYSSKVLRASMGAVARQRIIVVDSIESVSDKLKENAISMWGAVLEEDSVTLGERALPLGICIVIGNEANGIPKEHYKYLDQKIMIPMQEGAESLNASVAASLFAWELSKA